MHPLANLQRLSSLRMLISSKLSLKLLFEISGWLSAKISGFDEEEPFEFGSTLVAIRASVGLLGSSSE